MPSLWEGLPVAPLEAMALGCPVFLSDCASGPREILAPESGPARPLEEPELTAHGVLMPRTAPPNALRFRGDTRLNDAERIWADTLRRALDDDAFRLEQFRDGGLKRALDYDVTKEGPRWWRAVLG